MDLVDLTEEISVVGGNKKLDKEEEKEVIGRDLSPDIVDIDDDYDDDDHDDGTCSKTGAVLQGQRHGNEYSNGNSSYNSNGRIKGLSLRGRGRGRGRRNFEKEQRQQRDQNPTISPSKQHYGKSPFDSETIELLESSSDEGKATGNEVNLPQATGSKRKRKRKTKLSSPHPDASDASASSPFQSRGTKKRQPNPAFRETQCAMLSTEDITVGETLAVEDSTTATSTPGAGEKQSTTMTHTPEQRSTCPKTARSDQPHQLARSASQKPNKSDGLSKNKSERVGEPERPPTATLPNEPIVIDVDEEDDDGETKEKANYGSKIEGMGKNFNVDLDFRLSGIRRERAEPNFIIIDDSDDQRDPCPFMQDVTDFSPATELRSPHPETVSRSRPRSRYNTPSMEARRVFESIPNATQSKASKWTPEVFFNFNFTRDTAMQEQDRLLAQSAARIRKQQQAERQFRLKTMKSGGVTGPTFTRPVDVGKLNKNHWKWSCLYARLGLPVTATAATVRKQYRKLALVYHPDKCRHSDAATKFHAVTEAYHKLTR